MSHSRKQPKLLVKPPLLPPLLQLLQLLYLPPRLKRPDVVATFHLRFVTAEQMAAATLSSDPVGLGTQADSHLSTCVIALVALCAGLVSCVMLVSAMGEQRGRDAYLATYAFMTGAFIDRMHPESIDIADNVATVRIRNELTARQDIPEFMGQPVAKGQQIVLNLVGTYTIVNGTITRIEISPAA